MPAKNWRGKRHPGLVWRVLFGHNGPTRGELKKLLGLTFTKTFTLNVRDSTTGRVQKKRMRIGDDGRIQEVKAPAKKKGSKAKRPAAKKATVRRGGSQASKPSRASKSGSTPRRSPATPAVTARRRSKPEPLADRVLRNPDGTLAGSRPTDPVKQMRKAEQAYLRASRRAEHLLGWDQNPPQG